MKWTTKSGEVLDIKDMTDSHLCNAINFIKRNIENYRDNMLYSACMASSQCQGDMACDCANNAINRAENMSDNDILEETGYFELIKEKERRKLK